MVSLLWLLLVVAIAAGRPSHSNDQPEFLEPPAGQIQVRKAVDLPAWYWDLMVGGYLAHGHRDARWDATATNALGRFAAVRAGVLSGKDPEALAITNLTTQALEQGCADPLLQYLHWRRGGSRTAVTLDILQVADALDATEYSPLLKSYAYLRAFTALYPRPHTNGVPENARRARNAALRWFREALGQPGLPGGEFEDLGEPLCQLISSTNLFGRFWLPIEEAIGERYSDVPEAQLLLGEEGVRFAWMARGNGYADSVSQEGWRMFKDQLSRADIALRCAWRLDPTLPKVPCKMIWVCLGRGHPRKEMERWFSRAQGLSSGWYDLYEAKGQYLMPKWHGSIDEVLEFGRQCLSDTNAVGRARLMIVDFHEELEAYTRGNDPQTDKRSVRVNVDYFRNPRVWNDIRSAFEIFFREVPDATGWHHNYALHAWRAQDWKTLNSEIPKLGSINYKYFGGREAYDQMIADAEAHRSP